MIGFRLKLIAFAVVIIMALNLSPLDLFNNSASAASPPPDDGIDGFQVIDGSWDVSSQEEYTDEIIELNGNLIIHNGGVLTFNNVTLCMNITSSISKYYIEVQSGGRLIIQDKDGDPSTSDDASNITDSIYDYDNLEANASDYRYYFKVQSSGILKIINSNIRECGSKNGQTDEERGLYADSARLEISNTTFTNCYYTMFITGNYIEGVRNTLINYTTFARCTYGVILKNMDNVLFDHLMAYNYNHHVIHTDNVDDVYYKNCTFYNQLSSSTYVVYAYNSEGHYFSGCEFNKTLRTAIYLNNNGNIRVQNCSFISIPDHGILNYANYRPNHYFYDNIFSQISTGHHALYNDRAVNLNILRNHVNSSLDGFWSNYLSKVKIEHNRIQNCTRRAIHIYKSDTLIVTNNTNDHIKSTDWGVVMDQSGHLFLLQPQARRVQEQYNNRQGGF